MATPMISQPTKDHVKTPLPPVPLKPTRTSIDLRARLHRPSMPTPFPAPANTNTRNNSKKKSQSSVVKKGFHKKKKKKKEKQIALGEKTHVFSSKKMFYFFFRFFFLPPPLFALLVVTFVASSPALACPAGCAGPATPTAAAVAAAPATPKPPGVADALDVVPGACEVCPAPPGLAPSLTPGLAPAPDLALIASMAFRTFVDWVAKHVGEESGRNDRARFVVTACAYFSSRYRNKNTHRTKQNGGHGRWITR